MSQPASSRALAYLRWWTLVSALGLAVVAVVNWLVDPLQYYRKARYTADLSEQARYQWPGLARNYDYSQVVVGTSVSLGFSRALLKERLNWGSLNLAMSGASAHEQFLIMRLALNSGRTRETLWDVNYEYLRGDPAWVSDFDGAFPVYLYDDPPWDKIPNYLLNIDATKGSARVLLGMLGFRLYRARTPDELSALHVKSLPGRESVLASWRAAMKKSGDSVFELNPAQFAPPVTERSFERNYVALIREHPEVRFHLWFPPFSIARHAYLHERAPAIWDAMFRSKETTLSALRPFPNVRLYDFQGRADLVLNLDHYSDTVHFDEATREEIARAVAGESDLATPEELAGTEAMLRREVQRFLADPAAFGAPLDGSTDRK